MLGSRELACVTAAPGRVSVAEARFGGWWAVRCVGGCWRGGEAACLRSRKSGFLLAFGGTCPLPCWSSTPGISLFQVSGTAAPPAPHRNNQECALFLGGRIRPEENHCDGGILISSCVVAVTQPLMLSLPVAG